MSKNKFEEYKEIEREFYAFDDENKIVKMELEFDSPQDIIYTNLKSKVPVFTDDFNLWITDSIKFIPKDYKLNLYIEFADMNGYKEEELETIFKKNIILNFKTKNRETNNKNKIALALILFGMLFFIVMMIIKGLWETDNFWHEIFFYILDITTTVLFWEAAGILLVENQESRITYKSYSKKFNEIIFTQKNKVAQ